MTWGCWLLAFSVMISAKNLQGGVPTPVPFFRGMEVYLCTHNYGGLRTIVHSFHCELFLSLITLWATADHLASKSKKENYILENF